MTAGQLVDKAWGLVIDAGGILSVMLIRSRVTKSQIASAEAKLDEARDLLKKAKEG